MGIEDDAPSIERAREQRLEQWLHAACQQPDVPAPQSLHAEVMHSIERRSRQWWRQPALNWPLWASLILSLACTISLWCLVVNVPLAGSWLTVLRGMVQVLHDLLWTLLTGLTTAWALAMTACVLALAAGIAGLQRLAVREV